MEGTGLKKDFFRRIAHYLLQDPQRLYRTFSPAPLSPDELAQLGLYKVCLVKWKTIVELAEKNPQSFFDRWTYEYIDEGLEYDKRKLKRYLNGSAGELEVLMMDELSDFEASDIGFNGLVWDYSPCPNWMLCEKDPAISLLLGQGFIEPLPERGYYAPKYRKHWNEGVRKLLVENGIRASLKKMADPETGFIRNRSGKPYCNGNVYVTTRNW